MSLEFRKIYKRNYKEYKTLRPSFEPRYINKFIEDSHLMGCQTVRHSKMTGGNYLL